MPVPAAQYAALLARAVPALSLDQIEGSVDRTVMGSVPMAKGWALIHASCLLHGELMVFPGAVAQSRAARWMRRAMQVMNDQMQTTPESKPK